MMAVVIAVAAQAQDLKPVKDRDSKKFGYQDKSKNWVIEPRFDRANRFNDGMAIVEVQGLKGLIDLSGNWILKPDYDNIGKFDKSGFCEVMIKDGRQKRYGLIDRLGREVLPPDCSSINVNRSAQLIMAQRLAPTGPGEEDWLWGVYDMGGGELFEPMFAESPRFNNGRGVARSAATGLVGLISDAGEILIPFDNLAIENNSGNIEVLTYDFTLENYTPDMRQTSALRSPGSVIPYDPMDDDVRLAAWHCGCIGRRLHSNNVKAARITRDAYGLAAECSELPLDWGRGRFIRLEPEIDTLGRPGSLPHPGNGRFYTLRALMYEADGTYVGVVSDWGQLEASCREGFIYSAEGEQKWLIFNEINSPARLYGLVPLTDWYNIDNMDVISGYGLGSADLGRMQKSYNRTRRVKEIIESENVGISSYLPRRTPDYRSRRVIDEVQRDRSFRRPYMMGEVVSCRIRPSGERLEVTLEDRLICHFEDRFDDPYYSMEGEEEVWWGPHNARTVHVTIEEDSRHEGMIEDDIFDTRDKFKVVLIMCEEDGSYLRTLAEAPMIDFKDKGIMIFEKLGIAIIDHEEFMHHGQQRQGGGYRPLDHGQGIPKRIDVDNSSRLEPKLSALLGRSGGKPGADTHNEGHRDNQGSQQLNHNKR